MIIKKPMLLLKFNNFGEIIFKNKKKKISIYKNLKLILNPYKNKILILKHLFKK